MNDKKYFFWGADYKEGFCVIQASEGFDEAYLLDSGISLSEKWPSNVRCDMDPEYPKDIKLADNLYGAGSAVISGPIKELLISEQVKNVEFLAVTIRNHKGRVASKDYFIMNPLEVVDCIDIEKSGVRWNAIDSDLISSCDHIVLRRDAIPPTCKIFLPKFLPIKIFVHPGLIEKLVDAGFSGLYFTDPLEYIGI